jgi:hypothetical protein
VVRVAVDLPGVGHLSDGEWVLLFLVVALLVGVLLIFK